MTLVRWALLAFIFVWVMPHEAKSQQLSLPCYTGVGGAGCIPVSAATPLPVNATVSATATTTATAAATPPTVSAGANQPLAINLSSSLYSQPTFAGTPVDGTHGLPVNCIVGCAGGTSSNASSGVATSSTNGQTIAFGYAFNGTTWDQLQDDASKNLKVNLATAIPAGANVIGHVIADSGSTTAVTGNVTVVQPTASSLNATVVGTGTFATQATGAANVTATDCSGTVTTGGTAQNAFTAQTTLHGFTIANIDATTGSGEPMWVSFTTTAASGTTGSYPLAAPTATTYAGLSSYTAPPGFGLNHALSVFAATTGHKFSCTYY